MARPPRRQCKRRVFHVYMRHQETHNGTRSAQTQATPLCADERKTFNKRHLDPKDHLEKLQRQGMAIGKSAVHYITQVGGCRMKGYWYQWLDPATKTFREGTHFDAVVERYEFDRELRRISAEVLESIEITARTTISNVMSRHEGPHWFMKGDLFLLPAPASTNAPDADSVKRMRTLAQRVADEVGWMKNKPFIQHYRNTYRRPELPPSWAICECLSFGTWSAIYSALAKLEHRKEVSRRFRVEDPKVFATWLHACSVMRNTVAHHGRLLGAQTGVTPKPYTPYGLEFSQAQNRTFFLMATIINFMCHSIKHGPSWMDALEALFKKYPAIPLLEGLGFDPDWRSHPGWSPGTIRSPRRARRGSTLAKSESQIAARLKAAPGQDERAAVQKITSQ